MKCNHDSVCFTEIVTVAHQRHFDGNNYFTNNSNCGTQLEVYAECNNCRIRKKITFYNQEKQPRWIKRRIEIMKRDGNWFFS